MSALSYSYSDGRHTVNYKNIDPYTGCSNPLTFIYYTKEMAMAFVEKHKDTKDRTMVILSLALDAPLTMHSMHELREYLVI
jgi:hypothetical protein